MAIHFVGADPFAAGEGSAPAAGKINYFQGKDSADRVLHVQGFARVGFRNIYPGIGIEYYDNAGALEYDFHVARARTRRKFEWRLLMPRV